MGSARFFFYELLNTRDITLASARNWRAHKVSNVKVSDVHLQWKENESGFQTSLTLQRISFFIENSGPVITWFTGHQNQEAKHWILSFMTSLESWNPNSIMIWRFKDTRESTPYVLNSVRLIFDPFEHPIDPISEWQNLYHCQCNDKKHSMTQYLEYTLDKNSGSDRFRRSYDVSAHDQCLCTNQDLILDIEFMTLRLSILRIYVIICGGQSPNSELNYIYVKYTHICLKKHMCV